MEEIWKDVVGYESQYEVSNMGRVRSKDLKQTNQHGFKVSRKGQIRRLSMAGKYLRVTLKTGGKDSTKNVHVLVGEAFVGIRKESEHFDHIDNDKLNNRADNLRIVSRTQNTLRAASGKSKYPGIYFRKNCPKRPWNASVLLGDKRHYLGSFETEELAYMAYQKELKQHKPDALKYFEQENNILH